MNKLQLQVILAAVDKVTAPLKKMRGAGVNTQQALKETRASVKQLEQQTRQVQGYRNTARQLGLTSTQLKEARDNMARLAQEMNASTAPSKALTRSYAAAQRETVRLKTQQQQLAISQQRQRTALREAGIDTRNLSRHQHELTASLSRANDQLKQQKDRLAQVSAQQKKLSAARQRFSNSKALAGELKGKGATALATGAAGLYASASLLAPGMEYQTAQSKVQALTRLDANSPQLKALRDQARQLGADTSFTATDVSRGQAFLAMAGFTPNSIRAAMPAMLDLSKAGDVDLARTADISSNILSAFKMPADQMGKVADVLALTMTTSNVDLEMLAETMKYMGPIAKTAGMDLSEAAAAAGLLGNIGIQASNSGTALRAMLNRLAGPTKAAQAIFTELGVSTKDTNGDMRNIISVMTDVAKATEKMGSADRLSIYKTLFGEEAASGMNELISQAGSQGFAKYAKQLASESQGVAKQMAKVMTDNAQGDLDTLKSAFDDVRIQLFEGDSNEIRGLIKDITDVVRAVGSWVKANPALASTLLKGALAVSALAVAGGALTMTIGGLLGPFAMLRLSASVLGIQSMPMLSKGLGLFGTAATSMGSLLKGLVMGIRTLSIALLTTPMGWIVLGITALIAAGYLLITHWDTVKQYLLQFWEMIKPAFSAAWDFIKQLFGWTPLGMVINNWDSIKGYFATFWEQIKTVGSTAWDVIKQLFSWTPLGLFVGHFDEITSFLANLPERFTELGSHIIDGLITGIKSKFGALSDSLSETVNGSVDWVKNLLGIHSPSRVFAELGDYTMQGLSVGLDRSANAPLQSVANLSKTLKATTLSLGIASAPMVATANDTELTSANTPTTAPLTMVKARGANTGRDNKAPVYIDAGINAPITIQTQPGMDNRDILAMLRQELDRREQQQQAQLRTSLMDLE